MLKEAIISFNTYYNIDISGLPTMGGQSLGAATSKGHDGLFRTKTVQYWRRYFGNPWYWANIDIDVSTHPRDHRDIAIAVLQDALGKRAVGIIWGAFVHRIVVTLPSFHHKENHPHTLLCVVCVVQRILLTLLSSYSKEKDPSWNHPHTLLYVVCFVHRIVLTLPSSHSKEKIHHVSIPTPCSVLTMLYTK